MKCLCNKSKEDQFINLIETLGVKYDYYVNMDAEHSWIVVKNNDESENLEFHFDYDGNLTNVL